MAIVKMKFVSANTDRAHLDEMLLASMHSGLLDPVQATSIVNEENGGSIINEENTFEEQIGNLKNICHSINFELTPKKVADKTYTPDEINAFIEELNTKFELNANSESVTLSDDDEKAIEALRTCDFAKMHECQYITFGFGRLPAESFKKLSIYKNTNFVYADLHSNSQYHWIIYATSDTYLKETRKAFESLFLENMDIPTVDAKKMVEEYKEKITDVYSYCEINNNLFKLHQYVAIIDNKNIVAGFVPEKEVENYKSFFKDLPVDFRVKEPSEEPQCTPPTLLKNNWFFRPFELFVEMYSLPAYYDFDPTVFLGITYCILFGIMFGDLGQGALLFVGGLILEKKLHNKLCGIVGRVGITSMIFGFLFGSVFGNEELLNPIHQGLFHVRHKLFEVMDGSSTMVLLIGAVAIGAVLILTSMCLNIWMNIKHKKWGEVLFSQNGVAGFVFYAFVMGALSCSMLGTGVNLLTPPFIVIFIVLPVICFLMKEPFSQALEGQGLTPHQGWGGFFIESFFECFEIALSFVTNSMSYLRVGGFVLSHAGMMLVVMTLVEMTGNAGPVVLILGNLFVMGLEGLIVGIQTLRLEYYEMFSRYFTGGGKKFEILTSKE